MQRKPVSATVIWWGQSRRWKSQKNSAHIAITHPGIFNIKTHLHLGDHPAAQDTVAFIINISWHLIEMLWDVYGCLDAGMIDHSWWIPRGISRHLSLTRGGTDLHQDCAYRQDLFLRRRCHIRHSRRVQHAGSHHHRSSIWQLAPNYEENELWCDCT